MKTALIALVFVSITLTASAVEYVTLTTSTKTKNVSAGDLVEVVGTNMNNNGLGVSLNLGFADGASVNLVLRGKENGLAFADMKGNSFTGLTTIALSASGSANVCVTLKITLAEEISVVAPGTVLVVPETASGDLTVEVQSSTDLVNWAPFLTQEITAGIDPQFYRMRVVKTVAPGP